MRLAYRRLRSFWVYLLVAIGATTLPQAGAPIEAGPLSFEERVGCAKTVEEVYWRHRIWPAENPGPKPSLDEMLPVTALRERVTTYLEKSAALELLWARPLTGEQLQAELNRMVRNTKKPELLRELFAALGDDPLLAAECLARPLLADRLVRKAYARDARYHGSLREEAMAALANHPSDATRLTDLGGDYVEHQWRLASDESTAAPLDTKREEHAVIDLNDDEWNEHIGRLATLFDVERIPKQDWSHSALLDRIPLGVRSRLREEDSRFLVTAVLAKQQDRLTTATVSWRKRDFATWWEEDARAVVSKTGVDSLVPPSAGYTLRAPLGSGCTSDTWSELWYAPSARTDHTAVWTGTEMIIWGGTEFTNTGGRYDPLTDSWTATSIGSAVPTGRLSHTAVWTGTEMIVWGGASSSYGNENTGGRYAPLTDTWTATSTASGVPTPRQDHVAVWTGSEMIVWGGSHEAVYTNTGARYDPLGDSWTATSAQLGVPQGRGSFSVVWTGTEMIVWGGSVSAEKLDSGGRYDPSTDNWLATSVDAAISTARSNHSAIWTGTEMIVWGGVNVINQRTGARYNPLTDSWTATSTGTGVPTRRSGHSAIWTGTEMIVWGGYGGGYENSGGRYDPSTDSWTATSTGTGVPSARADNTAVWTGTEMIVWSLYDGGRYDPGTDSWTPVSTGDNVPSGREYPEAIWTGTEMIVWGGYNGVYENTGGRYDPAMDSWTATSTALGSPTGRRAHSTVWTGTEMIVWGGLGSSGGSSASVNTGGRYNPLTDSWLPTLAGLAAPSPRYSHTATWTGTEMIVWGGLAGVEVNTGGRYDPATNSWRATSTGEGTPSARRYHTAVWTGSEIIVWGGHESSTVDVNTGGRYNPATDSWTTTSIDTGVPEFRFLHSSAWTGTEMIVWGGYNVNGYPNTGGRYDPQTDSWMATSTGPGVPTGTYAHTSVWTGTEFIAWGGHGLGGVLLNSGGRYDPSTDSWTATSTGAGVPTGRDGQTTVWTGTEMIIWGGDNGVYLNSGGLYCACDGGTVSTWYPDADSDGYGAGSTGIPSCSQPPGYIAVGGDCDDTNADTYAGAAEINDGLDNQCPGDPGHGIVDEISGVCGFHNAADKDEFSWMAQRGATNYEVARSSGPLFATDCTMTVTATTQWVDNASVPLGTCFHYLVRALEPNSGSWGAASSGLERTPVCP